jgi:hypothetical protein
MQLSSDTAFMDATDAPVVARMLDASGYDGIICADHLIYRVRWRRPTRRQPADPMWPPDTAWPE